jgi:hypothetical protein
VSDCLVPPDVFHRMVDRLAEFVAPYQHVLETEAGQRNVHLYLQSLLFHIPTDFVVDQRPPDGESSMPLDFLLPHHLEMTFRRSMMPQITSIISMVYGFTTKSGGIWKIPSCDPSRSIRESFYKRRVSPGPRVLLSFCEAERIGPYASRSRLRCGEPWLPIVS